jgi:soluble lytic murein transglycosylase-like protein
MLLGLGFALLSPDLARAAERITLRNGFDVMCDHHALVDGRVRVYLKAAESDYFEVDPEAVGGVETVPNPPAAQAPSAPAQERKTADFAGKSGPEVRLSTADLHPILSKAGAEHDVDEDLLASVVKAESNGQVRAVSRTGARGLMQLMPGTAQELGVADSFAPEENVRGGTAYLDALLTRYHDNIELALAAYNAGPEAVDRYHGIPPYRETREYVARVVWEFNRRIAERTARRAAAAAQNQQQERK